MDSCVSNLGQFILDSSPCVNFIIPVVVTKTSNSGDENWGDMGWSWGERHRDSQASMDTIHIMAVMSSIVWVWWHRYSGPEVRYSGLDVIPNVVWCPKEWMWCHIEEIWCRECSVCDVIEHDHWCHKVWIWCDVDWVWCHMCAKCDDLHNCCDVIDTGLHRYRCVYHLCDDTDTVAVVSTMYGEMSGIVIVLSWKQYADRVHIGYDVINILGVMLYIEGYNVIKSCDNMHTE